MPALLANAAQLRAQHAVLTKLDPPAAVAIALHTAAAVEADAVLRECGIHLAALYTYRIQSELPTRDLEKLRQRIDALTAPLTHQVPAAQVSVGDTTGSA